ncbi:dimethylargininase [Angomonas deanei]|nr:dimethylargininase [Angomonas deanei]|eukprot:EPY39237.1 dimethylargininase [Angomonas deanei]
MPRTVVIVNRETSPAIDKQTCELTCIERQPISFERVKKQHDAYCAAIDAIKAEGYNIERINLPPLNDLPDSMFVEDVAMIYNDVAVLTRPGAPSRRPEVDPIVDTVKAIRPKNYRIEQPGIVDGGDVLYVRDSKYVFVGKSSRTNDDAFEQMKKFLSENAGLECVQCPTTGCLHLKCAVTFLNEKTILINPKWVNASFFSERGFDLVEIDPSPEEAESANVLNFVAEKKDDPSRSFPSSSRVPRTPRPRRDRQEVRGEGERRGTPYSPGHD